jgi:hypothetical protein
MPRHSATCVNDTYAQSVCVTARRTHLFYCTRKHVLKMLEQNAIAEYSVVAV